MLLFGKYIPLQCLLGEIRQTEHRYKKSKS